MVAASRGARQERLVLVADDDKVIRELLKLHLVNAGYRVFGTFLGGLWRGQVDDILAGVLVHASAVFSGVQRSRSLAWIGRGAERPGLEPQWPLFVRRTLILRPHHVAIGGNSDTFARLHRRPL